MIWLALLMSLVDPEWRIAETEIFQPLSKGDVLVRDDGGFYVRNFSEARITLYDGDGNVLNVLEGKKGKGPGEFTFPVSMFYDHQFLVVFDILTNRLIFYDRNNRYIKAANPPPGNLEIDKVVGGWVFFEKSHFGEGGDSILYWADDMFTEKIKVATIDHLGHSGGRRYEFNSGTFRAEFSPIDTHPFLGVSHDRTKAFLTRTSRFEILVIDVGSKKVIHTLKRDESRVPFDTEWADEQFEASMGQDKKKNKYKKLYPTYFPPFRSVHMDHKDRFVVDRWRGRPDKYHHMVVLTTEGSEVASPFKAESYERLVGVHSEYGYVLVFDQEEEEGAVAKCKLSDLDAFVAEHPIVFDGSRGYNIVVGQ